MNQFLIDPHNHFAVLLTLMVVVWGAGRIFKWMGLPPMLGEILSGVLVGPAVLGVVELGEGIQLLAELGVFFLMFHSGLDTNIREFVARSKASILIALGGMIPIIAASYPILIFLGISSLTSAFLALLLALNSIPVISSVLKTYNLKDKPSGHAVLGASVANEIILFVLLSVIIALAEKGQVTNLELLLVAAKVLLFFGLTLLLGKYLLPIISPHVLNRSGSKGFTFAMIVALAFGVMAEMIGLHMVLGAYLAGMFVREEITDDMNLKKIEDRFYGLSHSFLGPVFFATVGLSVSLTNMVQNWHWLLLLLSLVFVGQFIGSGLVAQKLGFTKRDAGAIGLALSGRGSTEIIIAKIGFATVLFGTNQTILDSQWLGIIVGLAFMSTLLMPLFLKAWLWKVKS